MGKYYTTNKFGEKLPTLLGTKEVAALMGENWDMQKLSVYVSRDQFIEPSMKIDKRPLWTLKRVEKFKEELDKIDNPVAGVRTELVKKLALNTED